MFGDADDHAVTIAEAKLRERAAAEATKAAADGFATAGQASALQRLYLEEELRLLQEVEDLLKDETENALAAGAAASAAQGTRTVGALRQGRRGGFDEGRASKMGAGSALIELQRRENKIVKSARLMKAMEAVRAAHQQYDSGVEADAVANLQEVTAATTFIQGRCEKRVRKMREAFLRRQGQLSDRLQRRVKRIQIDHPEIHDMKVRSILPSVVCGLQQVATKTNDKQSSYVSALQYLRPHRHSVERDRKGRHAVYLRQVERFENHLRRLADPNRSPDRGELFLSLCFRHVLAAGLAIDKAYFFRVLSHMEPEDFSKVYTVNLIAAGCDSFMISISSYISFLKDWGFPCLAPYPSGRTQVLSWEDGATWDGVELVELQWPPQAEEPEIAARRPIPEELDLLEDEEGEIPFEQDPLIFCPVLPPETPRTSALASRDDLLQDIIEAKTFDSVLGLYNLEKKRYTEEESAMQLVKAAHIAGMLTEEAVIGSTGDAAVSSNKAQGLAAKFAMKTKGEVHKKLGLGSSCFESTAEECRSATQNTLSKELSQEDSAPMSARESSRISLEHLQPEPPRTARLPRPPLQASTPPLSRRVVNPRTPFRGNKPFVPSGGHSTLRAVKGFAQPMSSLASTLTARGNLEPLDKMKRNLSSLREV
eukprot:TRINITY_DN67452_c0_g1_i1.p1 TRINITY_DN67452_c0_g1~~TRINITY_DN67452_c0_g1_i1.p1  ORF type:complete len:678 (-),score=135.58 TRINITY_DN67452_c0_g1_i1:65-2023(-)